MNPHLVVHRLTPVQAALASQCHVSTVYKALEGGALHGTQRTTGGRWLIRADCLDAWLDQRPCDHQSEEVTRLRA